MTEDTLTAVLEGPYRRWIITITTLLIALATILPAVDKYSALRERRGDLELQLDDARQVSERIERFESLAVEKQTQLDQLVEQMVTEGGLHTVRARLVDLVRRCNCQIRQIRVGMSHRYPWPENADPIQVVEAAAVSDQPSEYKLLAHELDLSVAGDTAAVSKLMSRLKASKYLMYFRSLDLQPEGRGRSQTVLHIQLMLFDVVRSADQQTAA